MINIDTLGKAEKVLNTESWIKSTLDQKRNRINEGTLWKETLSLAIQFGTMLGNVKKAKALSILGRYESMGHLLMQITKPTKDGRIEGLSSTNFEL